MKTLGVIYRLLNFFGIRKSDFLIMILLLPLFSFGQTTTGTFEAYSTIKSIGFEWNITGDTNHNAQCLVQYRINGSSTWLDALPLYRVDFEGYDMLAGSILFLDENTQYEVTLTFSDPDGGAETRTEIISTKPIPQLPQNGNTYHVIPGNGGGDGSANNPFQGISSAQNIAQAGDVFLLHEGDYGTNGQVYFTKSGEENNHIVWKSAGDGDVILNQIRIEADYIWFDGLNFIYNTTNNTYGVRTSPPGPVGIVFTYNYFENCEICIYLNDGGENWYIADNTIVGTNDPNNGSNFSGEGIELWHTSGHTIAYNSISRVGDAISYPHKNVDIYGNEIFDTTDDGIEGDYGHNNIRIWKNRISNTFNNGISFQPMNGAPWYILYNQVAAPGEDALKLRDRTDRVLLAHNTLVAWSGPVSYGSHFLRSMEIKNNLWISVQDRYIWENGVDGTMNWKSDFDYDGFDWGNFIYAFKWGYNIRLENIEEFQTLTGHEMNAIRIDRNTCFETFNVPNPPPASIPFQFMTLNPDCDAVDAGITLPNINDNYLGDAPDMGAYEYGNDLPHFGPRDETTLSINDLASYFNVTIHPNPTSDFFTISLNNQILDKAVIYNQIGQVLQESLNNKIDISMLPTGVYFVKIISKSGKIAVKKITKK